MTRRLLLWLLPLVVVASLSTTEVNSSKDLTPFRRFLEDGGNNNKNYDNMYTSFVKCFRVKIDNGNDDSEGNSYFYNGKYYAQYQTYVAFRLCSSNSCGDSCDGSIGYIMDLRDYLDSNVQFVQNYCTSCSQQCRRRLEDAKQEEEEEEQYYVEPDCNTCKNYCSRYGSSNGGYDEANYLECQAVQVDGDIQYYQAPSCENGDIVMGLYYDEDCTVRSNAEVEGEFNYDTFYTVQGMCNACQNNDAVCADLFNDVSAECYSDGQAGNDNNAVCKRYREAVRERKYSKSKRTLNVVPFFVTLFILGFVFAFLAQTYFIRHRNKDSEKKVPLSSADHGASLAQQEQPSAIPPIT